MTNNNHHKKKAARTHSAAAKPTTTDADGLLKIPKLNISVSFALPLSVFSNAQSDDLRTQLIGQVARSAAVFGVSEIVLFKDDPETAEGLAESCQRIFQYIETPQYLRKAMPCLKKPCHCNSTSPDP